MIHTRLKLPQAVKRLGNVRGNYTVGQARKRFPLINRESVLSTTCTVTYDRTDAARNAGTVVRFKPSLGYYTKQFFPVQEAKAF